MLDDSVVVVTGGAGLLGRAFSRSIARAGGIAVIADIDVSAAQSVADAVALEYPGRAFGEALDITDEYSILSLVARIKAEHGRIDAVVNNAYPRNANYGRPLEDVKYSDFCDNVSRHLGGYFLVAQQFGIVFREQNAGTIINMGSVYGLVAPRFQVYTGTKMTMPVEYAAIKAAVLHLTRYFAQYFKGSNVRVNSISPGGIRDGQPPEFLEHYQQFAGSKGMLDPSDIEGALLFLLSDMSQFVNGQNIVVDDGWSL